MTLGSILYGVGSVGRERIHLTYEIPLNKTAHHINFAKAATAVIRVGMPLRQHDASMFVRLALDRPLGEY